MRNAANLFRQAPALRRGLFVEAYMLTGGFVAGRCQPLPSVPLLVVRVYCRLFFDVSRWLGNRDWGRYASCQGLHTVQMLLKVTSAVFWKSFGCYGGFHVLDVMIAVSVTDGCGEEVGQWRPA